jgi:hypothetical protein
MKPPQPPPSGTLRASGAGSDVKVRPLRITLEMIEAARRAEFDFYQRGRQLGPGRFIPTLDPVIRAMLVHCPERLIVRSRTFRDMRSAPRDGSAIEIKHGPQQEIALACWSARTLTWVRVGDPERHPLCRVTGWRPASAK